MPADRDEPPTLAESALPAVTEMRFVVVDLEGGGSTIDVQEGEFEQVYNLRDPYSCTLFVALCRRHGETVYRRPRQRAVTVCVRTTVSRHAALWERFVVLSQRLDAGLADTTQRFVRDEVESGSR